MARLILANGAPGSGKSTLAAMFAAEHPLSLALDIDTVRGMLVGWLDHSQKACLAARQLAVATIKAHVTAGHDVLVPQFLARDFVLELEALAAELSVPLVEVALVSDQQDAVARFMRGGLMLLPQASRVRPLPCKNTQEEQPRWSRCMSNSGC